jgi:lysophospholipase L1-like esterase
MRGFLALALAGMLLPTGEARAQSPGLAAKFEQQVLEYEAADRATPPPQGAILFAGDSQFYRWKTIHEDLPGYTLVNRGVDSFQLRDLIHYADRLVVPCAPRLIVLHVGGNDVHNGRTPAQVETNRVIREYVATRPDLGFVDLWDAMLTADGKPREDLWVEDRVHPNHAGYLIRARLTRPWLGEPRWSWPAIRR